MKASVVRKLASEHSVGQLQAAADALSEREVDVLGVDGADDGEKLTHLMLAIRVAKRVEKGEALKDAFRLEMNGVRALLENS
jgi:hypothetical protein